VVPGTVNTEDGAVPTSEAGAKPRSLLRNRDFMLLWSGQVVSDLGSSISGIAFPLLVLLLSNNSAEAAGTAAALARLPYLFFSLPAGAFIDRWDRKRVMIVCDSGRALSLATIPLAMAFNALTIWQLFAVAFVEGTFYVFFNLAEVAAIPRVVPKAQLPAATAQTSAAGGTVGLIGPGIGGLIYERLGAVVPFVVDAFSYGASVVSLIFLKTNFKREPSTVQRHLGREIREGVSWLWQQPLIRFMAFVTGILNFVFSASTLIVIIAAKEMGGSADDIGLIFGIGAIGGIIGSIIGGRIQKRFSFGQAIIGIIWFQAILFPLYAVAPHLLVLGAISALLFLGGPVYNVVQYSYRLALIPDELQGRVNSSFRLLAFGFQPLGAFIGGILLERFGVVTTVMFFSAWMFAISILTTLNSHVRDAPPLESETVA